MYFCWSFTFLAEISCFKAEKPKMNEKLKWILVKGGLCFALISYVWQVHIKEDTIPFGSGGGLVFISIIMGLAWGLLCITGSEKINWIYKFLHKNRTLF